MPAKRKTVKRVRKDRRERCPHGNRITPGNDGPCGCRVSEAPERTETERRAQLAALEARAALKAAALKLVEQLALYWIEEGAAADEPGSAREAYTLLMEHGYTGPAPLRRPDGSEVTR